VEALSPDEHLGMGKHVVVDVREEQLADLGCLIAPGRVASIASSLR
jgi:hypothetical protein